jgi:hypothetical protein
MMRREAEERKAAAARKAEVEWRDRLAREKAAQEEAAAQRDRFASFKLLERIAEALERSSPRQVGVVPKEGPASKGSDDEESDDGSFGAMDGDAMVE